MCEEEGKGSFQEGLSAAGEHSMMTASLDSNM